MYNVIRVAIDVATPLILKLNMYSNENNCRITGESWRKAVELYRRFAEVMHKSYGAITSAKLVDGTLEIIGTVDVLDVYGETVDIFCQVLAMSDTFQAEPIDGEYIDITITLDCDWEAV